jgi:hypothetical protein
MHPKLTQAIRCFAASSILLASSICAASGFWIPYSAAPVPGTKDGDTGLFLIASNDLESSPKPQLVANTATQLLGLALKYTFTGAAISYSPDVMMYAAAGTDGNTHVYGLNLSDTTLPAPVQISSLSLPATKEICSSNQAEVNLATPTTMFVVINIADAGKCNLQVGTFDVVSYKDKSTTAPKVVKITTNSFQTLYNDGDLTGMVMFDSTTKTLNLYPNQNFTSPTQLLTGVTDTLGIATAGISNGTDFGTSVVFIGVTTASGTSQYSVLATSKTAVQFHKGLTGSFALDNTNLYFADVTSTTTTKIYQEPLAGGTATLLISKASKGLAYQLIGSNDTVLVYQVYSLATPSTATLYTVPVGKTSTSPTTIGGPYKDLVMTAFLAAPKANDPAGNILFATLYSKSTSGVVKYSSVAIPPNGPFGQLPTANSAYESFGTVVGETTGTVWQVTGITDTDGGWGGGKIHHINVSTLKGPVFTTTGGADYVVPAGYAGFLQGFISNSVAIGGLLNQNSADPTAPSLGLGANLSKNFILSIGLPNTNMSVF